MTLWETLIPILLADVLNPVLFGFMVYAAGTRQPMANSSAALLGHTAAYFTVGILIAPVVEKVSHRIAHPHSVDFIVSGVIGLLLVWAAWLSTRPPKEKVQKEYQGLTPVQTFMTGAVINFIALPFALPYFAAMGQILKADLTTFNAILVLLGYNLAYALPFSVVPVLVLIMGDESRAILERINTWIEKAGNVLMPVLLGLVGLALTADALVFFFTGKGLI